jgi:hypothetical protein
MEKNDDIYLDEVLMEEKNLKELKGSDYNKFGLLYLRRLRPPTSGSSVRLFSPVFIDEEDIIGMNTY